MRIRLERQFEKASRGGAEIAEGRAFFVFDRIWEGEAPAEPWNLGRARLPPSRAA